jgi:hypothetical protein
MVLVEILRHIQHGLVVIVPMQEFGEKTDRELDTAVPRAEALYQLAMKSLHGVGASRRFVQK